MRRCQHLPYRPLLQLYMATRFFQSKDSMQRTCRRLLREKYIQPSYTTQVHAVCSSPGLVVSGRNVAKAPSLGQGLHASGSVRAPLKRLRRAAEPNLAPSAAQEVSEATDQAEDPVDKVSKAHSEEERCREAGCGRPVLPVLNVHSSICRHRAAASGRIMQGNNRCNCITVTTISSSVIRLAWVKE